MSLSTPTIPVAVPYDYVQAVPEPPAHRKGFSLPQGLQNDGGMREFLNLKKWPQGLQESFIATLQKIPVRFFICDDSGSMTINDGNRLAIDGTNAKVISCPRFTELSEAMKFHVDMAHQACAPTEFRMLNSGGPCRVGFDFETSGAAKDIMFERLDRCHGGKTPLCRHIREITNHIRDIESELRHHGQRAVVIIATDGESTDGDLAEALRPLKSLPAWVVVRLCTSEEKVVSYYDQIDHLLEMDFDVLDDLIGESMTIYRVNPWLNYNDVLHRLREFGVTWKELDMIDEQPLSADQFQQFIKTLFGATVTASLPQMELNFEGYFSGLERINTAAGKVWNPRTAKQQPWIDIPLAKRKFRQNVCCTIS